MQQSLKNLDWAFKNFFAKRGGYPQFKSKRARQRMRYPQVKQQWIGQDGRRIYLPKEVEIMEPIFLGGTVDLDLGLRDFATLSSGEKIAPAH